jgi:hypothetical protein
MRRLDHHISAVAQYAMRSSNGPVTWRDYIMVLNLGSANGSESSRVVYKLWHYLLYRPFGADLTMNHSDTTPVRRTRKA